MNIASQLAPYHDKGFTDEQAEVITLMRLAAGVLFERLHRLVPADWRGESSRSM
jgi:hypothetical protein